MLYTAIDAEQCIAMLSQAVSRCGMLCIWCHAMPWQSSDCHLSLHCDLQVHALAQEANWKRCPSCRFFVERIEVASLTPVLEIFLESGSLLNVQTLLCSTPMCDGITSKLCSLTKHSSTYSYLTCCNILTCCRSRCCTSWESSWLASAQPCKNCQCM